MLHRSGEPLERVDQFRHVVLVFVDIEGREDHRVLVAVSVHDHSRLCLAHHTHATQLLEQLLQTMSECAEREGYWLITCLAPCERWG